MQDNKLTYTLEHLILLLDLHVMMNLLTQVLMAGQFSIFLFQFFMIMFKCMNYLNKKYNISSRYIIANLIEIQLSATSEQGYLSASFWN